jgi:hypothetical protein
MALTFDRISRNKIGPNRWQTVTKVTGDSLYASGGEAYTANNLSLGTLEAVTGIVSDGRYTVRNDVDNLKLRYYAGVVTLTDTITFDDCTDNTNTTGFQDFATTIPAGSVVQGWQGVTATAGAWSGDTTAVMQVGVDGDLDRFSAQTTASVFAAGTVGSQALAADARDTQATAITPRVTVTAGSDFGALSTESATVVGIDYFTPGGMTEAPVNTDLSAVVCYVTAIGTP